MKIFVKAKPNSKIQAIEQQDETHFIISVKEPPVQGRANQAIMKILADYFNIPASGVRLVIGFKERNKIFEIDLI